MKKLLLSLIALCGILGYASAAETTVTIKGADTKFGTATVSNLDKDTDFKFESNGFTFVTSKGSSTPTAYNKAGDLRIYAGGSITVTAPAGEELTKVVFNISSAGLKRLATITASVGDIDTQASGDETVTWTGKASSVKFTVGAKSDYGTESGKAGQLCFDSIVLTTEGGSGVVKKNAGLAFDPTTVTVKFGDTFTAPTLTKETTAAVTYTSSNEDVATVDEETGDVHILAVGTTTIVANTMENDEYYAGTAQYSLVVVKTYDTVAEFYTVGDGNSGLIGFDLIVTYVNGTSCYAQTKEGEATLVFGKTSYEVGDVIPAGWEGQYASFYGLPEIKPVGTMPESTETAEFTPEVVKEITLDDVNKVLVLQFVEFADATATGSTKTNFNGTVGETTYTFRNNFADVPSVDAGEYDVKFAVATYNNKLQLYPIEYSAPGSTTGIESVEAEDANAPVEFFNLQGVRVANPENGLFIRRQGNKVEKVVIR